MIYFVRQNKTGPIKIGFTENLKQRIIGLQVSNPEKLALLGTIGGSKYIERQIHQHLRFYHIGGEWFRASSFVLEFIYSLPDYEPKRLNKPKGKEQIIIISLSNIQTAEKNLIIKTLNGYKNNKARSAISLGMSRSTLYAKLKKYGIRKKV